jgi:hypothetical protein
MSKSPLSMTNGEIQKEFHDIMFTEYTVTTEASAENEQKRAALQHLEYLRWLASAPGQDEVAEAMRALASSDIEP